MKPLEAGAAITTNWINRIEPGVSMRPIGQVKFIVFSDQACTLLVEEADVVDSPSTLIEVDVPANTTDEIEVFLFTKKYWRYTITNTSVTDQTVLDAKYMIFEEVMGDDDWDYPAEASPITTTDEVVLCAGQEGRKVRVWAMQLRNTNGTATPVVLKDETHILWRGYLGANQTISENIVFSRPLKCSDGHSLIFACTTTGAAVYVNAQGNISGVQ